MLLTAVGVQVDLDGLQGSLTVFWMRLADRVRHERVAKLTPHGRVTHL